MIERVTEGRRVAALRFWRVPVAFACAAALAAAGCHRPSDAAKNISVHEELTPQPVRVGPTTIAIELADASGQPLTHATINVEADMSHPGMGPVTGTAIETAPGTYIAHLDFNMAGDWVVLSHIKLADGSKVERQIDVRGVEPN